MIKDGNEHFTVQYAEEPDFYYQHGLNQQQREQISEANRKLRDE